MRRSIVRAGAVCVAVIVLLVPLENVLTSVLFPRVPARLTTDFSARFLERELAAVAKGTPQVVFLGDSVLWGYRIPAERGAISLLRARGCACLNLAFKGGSPPNYDAMVRLLLSRGVRPARVVIEIDQKVFNAVDDSYATLHPSLSTLARSLLPASERVLLTPQAVDPQPERAANAMLEAVWMPYAMRADVRETFASDDDETAPHGPTADELDSTYDLSALTRQNAGVRFLTDAVDVLHRSGIESVAFLTPTNHKLVGEYIDNPQYRERSRYLRRLLEARGVRVIDLDSAVPSNEFLDEVHLTVPGNERLAELLQPALQR